MLNNKKVTTKYLMILIILIMTPLFVIGCSQKPDPNAKIVAKVRKAPIASAAVVELTDKGKKEYPNAAKYQIYYEGKAVSGTKEFGSYTTVFPERKEKDKVQVHILDSKDKEIDVVEAQFMKAPKAKGSLN